MFSLSSSGSFKNAEAYLLNISKFDIRSILESAGKAGVAALESATPADTGLAGESWSYEVTKTSSGWTIGWKNDNVENGFPVALMIQMGHGTGTGGYIQGRDYINPAMRPIFDKIADQAWKAVTAP